MEYKCDNCGKVIHLMPSRYELYNKHYCSSKCKYEAEKMFNPNIENFIEDLWKHPITELSNLYGVSVKTIHKFIKKNNIWDRPRRGHRQKIENGIMTIEEVRNEVKRLYGS